jgi:hypothetical protein
MPDQAYRINPLQCDLSNIAELKEPGKWILQVMDVPASSTKRKAIRNGSGSIENLKSRKFGQDFKVDVLSYLRLAQVFPPSLITYGSDISYNNASPQRLISPPGTIEHPLSYFMCKAVDLSIVNA